MDAIHKVEGLIFDLDGVIVSTDQYHYQAWKKIADEIGIYFDEKINHRLRGVGRMESLEIILEQYHGDPLTQNKKSMLAEEKNEIYKNLLKKMTPLDVSGDVRSTLAGLKNRGYHLALGSSSKNARFILKQIKLEDAFEKIVDGTDILHSKPDPEVFLKAAKAIGLSGEDCVVIEDSASGIEAAKAAGMLAIAVGNAKESGRADMKLDFLSQLLKLFL